MTTDLPDSVEDGTHSITEAFTPDWKRASASQLPA